MVRGGTASRRKKERRKDTIPIALSACAPRLAALRSFELKARGRFSEATGAGGIRARAELDYTAKGVYLSGENVCRSADIATKGPRI